MERLIFGAADFRLIGNRIGLIGFAAWSRTALPSIALAKRLKPEEAQQIADVYPS